MCGIAGFWDLNKKRSKDLHVNINNMTSCLDSRGPDDKGLWIDKKNCIAFGHRRLSILELSELGKQPMFSKNKRFVISYNGEIYNYLEIKEELKKEGKIFKSNCDTEVLIESIDSWGIEKTLNKIAGMFSFAVWDNKNKKLYLARDRLGIKPLYWSLQNKIFYFGSQPKCFIENKFWKKKIEIKNILYYFQFGYIAPPNSVFERTYQVEPGNYLSIDFNGSCKIKRYWDINKKINKDKRVLKEEEYTEELKRLLNKVVSQHLISDVPLGSFLSGGIDSSTISLIMSQQKKNIETFSVGYKEKSKIFDESEYATNISKIIGSKHTNLEINPNEILNNISNIVEIFDEPFSDSSQLPTFLLSKLVRKRVTVCLSGDGGDEVFGGYNRYLFASKIKKIFNYSPYFLRKLMSKIFLNISPTLYDNFFQIFGKKVHTNINGDKIHKFSGILGLKNFEEMYEHLLSFFPVNEMPINNDVLKEYKKINFKLDTNNLVQYMQLTDTNFYLPGDILTKVDRASMAHGLEMRVPFLDHRVVEFACNLPENLKIHQGETKKILRNILNEKINRNFFDRPKMGFAVPLSDWLRGPLKDWAWDLINQRKLNDGLINVPLVKKIFHEHVSNKRNWQNKIWTILVYIIWKEKYI